MMSARRQNGFTLAEALTVLIVVVVLAAIAIPMYRSHLLRARRADAVAALLALQNAQDRHFGRHARYADTGALARPAPDGLGLEETSERGFYRIELRTAVDGLGYEAIARTEALAGQAADTRCTKLTIDQNNTRRAFDADGTDRSADCWR